MNKKIMYLTDILERDEKMEEQNKKDQMTKLKQWTTPKSKFVKI